MYNTVKHSNKNSPDSLVRGDTITRKTVSGEITLTKKNSFNSAITVQHDIQHM